MKAKENCPEINALPPLSEQVEHEISEASFQMKVRTPELVVTSIFLTIGLFFYGIGMTSIWTLSIVLFGALWNFFTDSNKLFACVFALLVCIPYAYFASEIGMYAQAFLHLIFYLPTQFIYYIENKNKKDIGILKSKRLEYSGLFGTAIAGVLLAFGIGAVVYNMSDEFFVLDAISSVLLMISVFLVNGRYKDYWAMRIFAVGFAAVMWLLIGIVYDFIDGTIAFTILFAMYTVMDTIKYINWCKSAKEAEEQEANLTRE